MIVRVVSGLFYVDDYQQQQEEERMSALLRVALCCVGFVDAETVEHARVTCSVHSCRYLSTFCIGQAFDQWYLALGVL